ncbi:ferrochelatase [soil metagenome]
MRFHAEPAHQHGTAGRTAVLLVNLGTPDEPTPAAVRRYLNEFLSDPRVVEIPALLWWFILHLAILPFRSRKSAEKYAAVWTGDGSPLAVHTQKQARLLRGYLGERGHQVEVLHAMRYGNPSLPDTLSKLKNAGFERILILPAYPQYSATTTASTLDAVARHFAEVRHVPEWRFVKHYHDDPGYISALKESVLAHWQSNGRPAKLIMSFHGLPKRNLSLGDPYFCECQKTARLLATALGLTEEQYAVCFQSRLGKAEWLQPYTTATVRKLAKEGVKRIDVICPGFPSDCLETLEEIAIEARKDFLTAGGTEFNYIPCLNESHAWITALAVIAEKHMLDWPTQANETESKAQEKDAQLARAHALKLGAKK